MRVLKILNLIRESKRRGFKYATDLLPCSFLVRGYAADVDGGARGRSAFSTDTDIALIARCQHAPLHSNQFRHNPVDSTSLDSSPRANPRDHPLRLHRIA